MRDAIVQLCCCVFYKAFLTDPKGSSQELTLRATIATLGSVSSRQLLFHVHLFSLKREYDFIWSHVRSMNCVPATRDPLDPFGTIFVNCSSLRRTCSTRHLGHSSLITVDEACAPSAKTVSGTSSNLLDEVVSTYQERLASYSYSKKMFERIRDVLKVTWRRCYNVSGTSCKLLEEVVTTYQEVHESYLKKMLQRFETYQERLPNYLKTILQRIRNVLQVTWRRCYNVSGTLWKLLEEVVETYKERFESYLKKMLQRIRNVLRRLLEEDVTTYQQRLASSLMKMLQRFTAYQERLPGIYLKKMLQRTFLLEEDVLQVTWRSCFNVSGTPCKLQLLEEDVWAYQGRLESYSKNMFERIRDVLKVTWRRCFNVSGTSCKLLEEDVTTYQERLASYLKKMLQRIRNVLQGTWRSCFNVSGTSCNLQLLEEDVWAYQERLESYLKKMLQRIKNVLQVTWRSCYNVSGTSWKLLEEDVTTYQERLASCLQKMLQSSCKSFLTTQTTGRDYTLPKPLSPQKNTVQKWQQSRPSIGAVT